MKKFSIFLLITLLSLNFSSQNKYTKVVSNILKKINIARTSTIDFPYISNILNKYYYNKTDMLLVTTKGLHAFKQQIPYDYSYLGLCERNKKRPPEGISELLTGKKSSFTNYLFSMKINETCVEACSKNFTKKDFKKYKWLIDRHYFVTYYLDKLPSGYFTYFKDKAHNKIKNFTNYHSGIPIGFKKNGKYYINNHLIFYVSINKKNEQYQIVDFFIEVHSVEQEDLKKCIDTESSMTTHLSENKTYSETKNNNSDINVNDTIVKIDQIDENFNIIELNIPRYYKIAEPQELLPGKKIGFTYDVIFLDSNMTFSTRFDHYFTKRRSYHWLNLIYSNLIIFFLSFTIFYILRRTVNKDLYDYNRKVKIVENEEIIIDEYGWKQINRDVFRKPKKLMLLSAFIGTGIEILNIFIVALILSVIGFIKPEKRGDMINSIIYSCIFMSVVAGYVSTYIYRNNNGKEWLKNIIITAFLFPFISILVIAISRILMSFEQSSASFKIGQMALLILLWLFISSPLVLLGGLLCLMKNKIKYPCKVNALPTKIGEKPWYLHLQYAVWFTGIIPFATIFVEFLYVMSFMWQYQVYYLASFLSLSVFFEVIITAEISIVFVFVNLCKGDYNWWWKSFFVSASPTLYVLFFSIYYFFKLNITRFTAIVVYFLIMGLITIACGLLNGACGSFITFWFVYYIYSKIKID